MALNKRLIPEPKMDDIQTDIFDACGFGIIILDEFSRLIHWNSWVSKHANLNIADTKGEHLEVIFPILNHARLLNAIDDALHYQLPSTLSHKLNRRPFQLTNSRGKKIEYNIKVIPIKKNHDVFHCLIEITDISAVVKRENQLREISAKMRQEKEWASSTLQSIADAVITTDPNGQVISLNNAAESLIGLTFESAQGEPIAKICPIVQSNKNTQSHPVLKCLDTQQPLTDTESFLFKSSQDTPYAVSLSIAPIIDIDNSLLGSIMVFRDITQSRQIHKQLNWQATHDHLTGLINRRELETQLEISRIDVQKNKNHYCLMYVDLDQFKIINDTCGHGVGDKLLCEISELVKSQLRQDDVFARIGGDEFCILLPMCPPDKALLIAETIRQSILDHRFVHEGEPYALGASIGLAEITGQENSLAEVLSAADSACYVAKSMGRNRVHVHDTLSVDEQPQEMMRWFTRLQAALEDDRFILYAQEIASITTKQTPHFEVLIRMIDNDGKIIPPNSFIPAAERFHLMQRIDRWVIKHVCEYIADLEKQNIALPIISINLSGTSVGDPNFLQATLDIFEQYQTPSKNICFEITETAAISNLKDALHFMAEMKKLNCKFSLDDFGSGLSSFAYLKDMPIDYLKIDGHFIKNITQDKVDKAFVDSINQIAQVMNIKTIAEFVENDDILDILKTLGVDYAQGYGISKPAPLSSLNL